MITLMAMLAGALAVGETVVPEVSVEADTQDDPRDSGCDVKMQDVGAFIDAADAEFIIEDDFIMGRDAPAADKGDLINAVQEGMARMDSGDDVASDKDFIIIEDFIMGKEAADLDVGPQGKDIIIDDIIITPREELIVDDIVVTPRAELIVDDIVIMPRAELIVDDLVIMPRAEGADDLDADAPSIVEDNLVVFRNGSDADTGDEAKGYVMEDILLGEAAQDELLFDGKQGDNAGAKEIIIDDIVVTPRSDIIIEDIIVTPKTDIIIIDDLISPSAEADEDIVIIDDLISKHMIIERADAKSDDVIIIDDLIS